MGQPKDTPVKKPLYGAFRCCFYATVDLRLLWNIFNSNTETS